MGQFSKYKLYTKGNTVKYLIIVNISGPSLWNRYVLLVSIEMFIWKKVFSMLTSY